MKRMLLAGLALGVSGSSFAITAFVNSNQFYAGSVDAVRWSTSYRLSHSTWDQGIFVPAGGIVSNNLANVPTLTGKTFAFTLDHIVGSGLRFRLVRQDTNATSIVSWGSNTLGGTNAATLSGQTVASNAFNALRIQTEATTTTGNQNPSFTVSNLTFSGITKSGTFLNTTVTPVTGDLNGPLGLRNQMIVATDNLAGYNWTLTGTVIGTRSGNSGDDTVRILINGEQVNPVPEPGTIAGLALGATALLRRRRR